MRSSAQYGSLRGRIASQGRGVALSSSDAVVIRSLVLLAVVGCSDALKLPEPAASTRAMIVISEEPLEVQAISVEPGHANFPVEPAEITVLQYDRTLAELGLVEGKLAI